MIVVSDTSPIGSLILIERLELLPAIFGQVLIPEKVFTELLVLETDFGPFLVFPIKAKSFQTKPKRGGKRTLPS
jgi:predicted nucleic acid-binding protein